MRILLLAAATLFAQDAELVLRTSVSYNTQRLTRPLNDAQKAEAESLGQQAQTAARLGEFKEAMRHYHHGFATMHGVAWTPAVELASAIEARVDDAIARPGQKLQMTLDTLYPTSGPATAPLRVVLRPVLKGADVAIAAPAEIDSSHLPLQFPVKLPDDLKGSYNLVAEIGAASPEIKTVTLRVADLEASAARLQARLSKQSLPVAQYAMVLYEKAEKGKVNPQRFDFEQLFAEANQLLDTAATGKDPFAGRKGDLHQAYLSTVDQTLQPYRIFVPSAYAGKPTPLVIALHGMGGDETSMMEGYTGVFRREAERHGFLLVTPKGREPASMYRGTAEKDVLDVLAEVERAYRVDPKRIYLMGHSMGGYGTWSIAMDYPERFAALGPIAGGGNPGGMEKLKLIPQIVVHGDKDKTVPATQSRAMVEAGKKAGAKIEYIEVPGGGHVDIAVPNVPLIFDFFAKQARE